jgi:hypothetical protein
VQPETVIEIHPDDRRRGGDDRQEQERADEGSQDQQERQAVAKADGTRPDNREEQGPEHGYPHQQLQNQVVIHKISNLVVSAPWLEPLQLNKTTLPMTRKVATREEKGKIKVLRKARLTILGKYFPFFDATIIII